MGPCAFTAHSRDANEDRGGLTLRLLHEQYRMSGPAGHVRGAPESGFWRGVLHLTRCKNAHCLLHVKRTVILGAKNLHPVYSCENCSSPSTPLATRREVATIPGVRGPFYGDPQNLRPFNSWQEWMPSLSTSRHTQTNLSINGRNCLEHSRSSLRKQSIDDRPWCPCHLVAQWEYPSVLDRSYYN